MPTYDYRCPANGRVLEVFHGMSERVASWGELCALAGIEPGETDPQAPVERAGQWWPDCAQQQPG